MDWVLHSLAILLSRAKLKIFQPIASDRGSACIHIDFINIDFLHVARGEILLWTFMKRGKVSVFLIICAAQIN